MPVAAPASPPTRRIRIAASVFLLLITLAGPAIMARAQTVSHPEIVAYVFPNLPGDAALTATSVDGTMLTRINYAFALIRDGRMVEGTPNDATNLSVLRTLRIGHPDLKLLVSVGGWLGSGGFSDAALTPASRKRFVDSALDFLMHYDLDGLDIDWEYPGQSGADNKFRPEDGANFTLLLRDLRARFDAQTAVSNRPLLLTIAAGASLQFLAHTQMGEAARYLDSVNLMAYDYYEPGSKPAPTGNHAPLFPDPADPQHASADVAMQAFEQAGVPAGKLILGVPFYGHAWADVPPANNGLFQKGVAAQGLHTSYPDIQALLASGFTRYWDAASQVPYAYNPTTRQWVSYEDPESLQHKCAYVQQHHLGGIMFWQYFSDSTGSLVTTIHQALLPDTPAGTRP